MAWPLLPKSFVFYLCLAKLKAPHWITLSVTFFLFPFYYEIIPSVHKEFEIVFNKYWEIRSFKITEIKSPPQNWFVYVSFWVILR